MRNGDHHGRDHQIVLFHLSDPHIGASPMPPPQKFHRWLRAGYNPHDSRLFRPLELAVHGARRRFGLRDDEPLNVLISGDLTRSGLDNEYAVAMALLHHRWQWRYGPMPRWIGFGWPHEQTFTVPGNHDHWRRPLYQTAHTRGLAPAWFEPTPWRRPIESSDGTLRLELYGVDSNSGLENPRHPGKASLFAGGAVSSDEIEALEVRLTEARRKQVPGRAVVRALVCHHAFSKTRGVLEAHPLAVESRRALETVAADHFIGVALTGHTHAFHVQDWPIASGARASMLKELRSATTLQGTRNRPGLQGFWVHQIIKADGSDTCRWTAWKYQAAGGSFEVDLVNPVTFLVPSVPALPAG